MTRGPQEQIRGNELSREADKCMVSGHYNVQSEDSYPGELPFDLANFKTDEERLQTISIWTNIFRYFPSLRSRLNHYYENINSMENVMILSQPLHKPFGRFSSTLEPTETVKQCRVKTFRQFSSSLRHDLPRNEIVTMKAHDGRFPLPLPILLQIHSAIANILHATGSSEKMLRDDSATDNLDSDHLACLKPEAFHQSAQETFRVPGSEPTTPWAY